MILVMLKKRDRNHPDIKAYEELFGEVKRISRSGDTEPKPLMFFEGMVARTTSFLVKTRREFKAAVKVEKLKISPGQVAKMKEAATIIGGMTSGPNGTLSVAHRSTDLASISAGVEHPQAYCLPPSTKVFNIPSDGRTMEQIAQSLEEQRLLVPDLPHGQPVTPEQLKVVVAALFGLNINPKTSMILCLVSTAGQLAEDGHNEAALILLGW